MTAQYYRSKIDWWVNLTLFLVITIAPTAMILAGLEWYLVLIAALIFLGIIGLALTSVYYIIKGDQLGVKGNGKCRWYPIENIKSIKRVKSILAAPALSTDRISIKFEHGTTKLAVPLEISPKDIDAFIHDLLEINPEIKIE